MRLLQHPNFVKEYTEFSDKIAKISDPTQKKELEQLLTNLVFAVKALDRHHEETILYRKPSSSNGDRKNEITEIRKKLKNSLL